MEVKAYENPLPFIYIENLYTEEELKGIWAELDYYQANGNILGNGTRPAKDENDQEKTVKTGIFTDNVFYNREHSNILTLNRKIFDFMDYGEIQRIKYPNNLYQFPIHQYYNQKRRVK